MEASSIKTRSRHSQGEVNIAEMEEPRTFQEAITGKDKENWIKAMENEMQSLKENDTWTLISPPENTKVVSCKWIFKIKEDTNGRISCYKARLVARGYSQTKGLDFEETFAPVASRTSLRTLLSVAAAEDWEMEQFDVRTAFLYVDLEEEIFMEQPEGFIEGKESDVCLLKKSLYGLKQAPRQWDKKFKEFLRRHGLTASTADPCVFNSEEEERILILILYVDDGICFSNKRETLIDIINEMKEEFKITTGSVSTFIGMNVTRNRKEKRISLNQTQYISKVLKIYRMEECNPVSVPADPNAILSKGTDQEVKNDMSLIPYREAVGHLMYLSTCTRPDIAYAVSALAQFSHRRITEWEYWKEGVDTYYSMVELFS